MSIRAVFSLVTSCILLAVTPASFASTPVEMRLWEGVAPGSEDVGAIEEVIVQRGTAEFPDRKISGVTVPTMTAYFPSPAVNTGTAVIVCPGGGYSGLAIDKEGHEIARYLNTIGVTAMVLKYRLPRPEGFVFPPDTPLRDAIRAIRLTRYHAEEWGLDPDRIGIMGFSAGGHLASTAATTFDSGRQSSEDPVDRLSSRPDLQVLVYAAITLQEGIGHTGLRAKLIGKNPSRKLVDQYSNELQVTADSPPAFLVSAYDDYVKAENSLLYYQALRTAGVPAELHIYESGGHGYGIRPSGTPVSTWHHRLAEWLQQLGLLDSDLRRN